MGNLKARIERLERQALKEDSGMTFDEIVQVCLSNQPEEFKKEALSGKLGREVQRIAESPPPKNLPRLVARFNAMRRRCQDKARRSDEGHRQAVPVSDLF